jgi:hypothetical protein
MGKSCKPCTYSLDLYTTDNLKLTSVIRKIGWEGVGMFLGVIEYLHQNNNQFLFSDLEIFAYKKMMDEQKLRQLINDFDLFAINGTSFYSVEIQKQMQEIAAVKEARSKAGKKGMRGRYGITSDNNVITEDNNVITKDNNVITKDNNVITSDNNVITKDNNVITSDNNVITEDNNVITKDNNVITSDNNVITSDNNVITSDNNVIKKKNGSYNKEKKEKYQKKKEESSCAITRTQEPQNFDFEIEDGKRPDWIRKDLAEDFKKWRDYAVTKQIFDEQEARAAYQIMIETSGGDAEQAHLNVLASINGHWSRIYPVNNPKITKGGATVQNTGNSGGRRTTPEENKQQYDKVNAMAEALKSGKVSMFNN